MWKIVPCSNCRPYLHEGSSQGSWRSISHTYYEGDMNWYSSHWTSLEENRRHQANYRREVMRSREYLQVPSGKERRSFDEEEVRTIESDWVWLRFSWNNKLGNWTMIWLSRLWHCWRRPVKELWEVASTWTPAGSSLNDWSWSINGDSLLSHGVIWQRAEFWEGLTLERGRNVGLSFLSAPDAMLFELVEEHSAFRICQEILDVIDTPFAIPHSTDVHI